MSIPIPSRRWWVRVRSVLAVVLTATGGSYAVFGNELFTRVGAVFDRTGRRVSNTTEELRTRSDTESLEQAREAFDKLQACREALAQQVQALREHRGAVVRRLDQDSALLRRVLAAREKPSRTGDVSRDQTERDATEVLRRVQVHEDELVKCDAELRTLTESLERLDLNINQASLVVQQQADELERRKAGTTGRRAYHDGRDLSNQIVKSSR